MQPQPSTSYDANPRKVLIIDMERENRTILMQCLYPLRKQGVELFTAADGDIAKKMIEAEHPDLVLMDVTMPGLNRYEMCKLLKAEQNHPHIIMMTERSLCTGNRTLTGADECIAKPFQPKDILEHAQHALGLSVN